MPRGPLRHGTQSEENDSISGVTCAGDEQKQQGLLESVI